MNPSEISEFGVEEELRPRVDYSNSVGGWRGEVGSYIREFKKGRKRLDMHYDE